MNLEDARKFVEEMDEAMAKDACEDERCQQCGYPGTEQWPLVYECAQGHVLCAWCGKDGCTVCAMQEEEPQ